MPPPAAATRHAALVVWAAMLALPVAFLGMSETVARAHPAHRAPGSLLFWVAVAASALGIVLSRVLPRRITPGGEGASPGVVAFTRMAVSWALVEAVALFPPVARLLAPDPRQLGVFAVDLVALATLFPGESRWASLGRHDRPARPAGRG